MVIDIANPMKNLKRAKSSKNPLSRTKLRVKPRISYSVSSTALRSASKRSSQLLLIPQVRESMLLCL